jgi:hypothetical protein
MRHPETFPACTSSNLISGFLFGLTIDKDCLTLGIIWIVVWSIIATPCFYSVLKNKPSI